MTRIVVTGADGFVGGGLCQALVEAGHVVTPVARDAECAHRFVGFGLETHGPVIVGDIGPHTDWDGVLPGAEVVIHLAARVHVMKESEPDPLAAFRKVNTQGTEKLAESAARAGVRRVVMVSTIKVNGEGTDGRRPFSETDAVAPDDPYAVSKLEAETALARVSAETNLEFTVVRPPLVYGPGVGGNLLRLMKLMYPGFPLPFGSLHNKRSLICVRNLCDILMTCAVDPAAANQVFTVCDMEDISTSQLLRYIASGFARPARLWPLPPVLMDVAFGAMGRREIITRLAGSLQVDAGKARTVLGWSPPIGVEEGLMEMAVWYRMTRQTGSGS